MSHPILLALLRDLPMMAAAIGVMVAAFVLWRRAPLSSLLLVLACGSSLLLLILYPFAFTAVLRFGSADTQSVARISALFGIGWSIFRALYLIVMAVAIYAGRRNHEHPPTT
jgi:hypothetical protein